MKYLHLKQSLNSKGQLIPFEDQEFDLSKLQTFLDKAPNSDFYRSLFWYDAGAQEYFNSNEHSISNYKGKVFNNLLAFDFDSEGNPQQALEDVKKLLKKFQHEENILPLKNYVNVFFSGNKGFHVELLIDQDLEPAETKEICSNIADKLETFDSVIYNATRVYRLPNTKHQKSGLYKIPIDIKDLKTLTIEEIKEKAKNKVETVNKLIPYSASNLIKKYKNKIAVTKPSFPGLVLTKPEENGIRGLKNIDFTRCPKTMPRCVYALKQGIMVPKALNPAFGGRSNLFLRLATYFRNQGDNEEVVKSTLSGIASLNKRIYPEYEAVSKEEIIYQHVKSAFSEKSKKYHSVGGPGTSADEDQLKLYCDALNTDCPCCLHNNKTSSVVTIDQVSDLFEEFAQNLDKNLIKTGIDFIDNEMKITTGTTTLLTGCSGIGKTTFALNIMENANAFDQATMFFSLDMNKLMVFQKLAQKCTNYNQNDILKAYKTKNTNIINEVRAAVLKYYNITFFDFTKALNVNELRDSVLQTQDKAKKEIKLVVVDHAGRLTGEGKDSYLNAKFNALNSTQVAEDTNSAWIFLNQIARSQGDGSTPLRTKRAQKDTSEWEENASNIITMWRPFLGLGDEDRYIRMFIAKNRSGKELETILRWEGSKGAIREFTEQDHIEWEMVKEREIELLKQKNKTKFPTRN